MTMEDTLQKACRILRDCGHKPTIIDDFGMVGIALYAGQHKEWQRFHRFEVQDGTLKARDVTSFGHDLGEITTAQIGEVDLTNPTDIAGFIVATVYLYNGGN